MAKEFSIPKHVLCICNGSKCTKKGGKDIAKAARKFAKKEISKTKLRVIRTHCTDNCDFAPVAFLQPENQWWKETSEEEMLEVLKKFK